MQIASSRGDGRSAFTLIELMVVCVLMGILSAMIIPEMRGTFEDALLRSSGREIINTFDLANSRAISLSRPYRVQLDEHSRRYFLEQRASDTPDVFVPVHDLPGCEGTLDDRIVVQIHKAEEEASSEPPRSPAEGIGFYPDGTADPVEVLLRDRAGFRLVLRLNPVTSRVRIVELGRE